MKKPFKKLKLQISPRHSSNILMSVMGKVEVSLEQRKNEMGKRKYSKSKSYLIEKQKLSDQKYPGIISK